VRVRVRLESSATRHSTVIRVLATAGLRETLVAVTPGVAEELGLWPPREAELAVQEGLWEPLITDAAIDALGIQVVKFKEGLWRHIGDPPGTVRRSAQPPRRHAQ